MLLGASLLQPRPLTAEQEELVWASPLQALRGSAWPGIGNYRRLAALLFVVMVGLYVVTPNRFPD